MKINNFQGELTDVLAKTAALPGNIRYGGTERNVLGYLNPTNVIFHNNFFFFGELPN